MWFFDSMPMGGILHRFSKDLDLVDAAFVPADAWPDRRRVRRYRILDAAVPRGARARPDCVSSSPCVQVLPAQVAPTAPPRVGHAVAGVQPRS